MSVLGSPSHHFSYQALNDAQDQIQSRAAGIINYHLPSYGIFSTSLQTSYWFGLPRNVSFNGLSNEIRSAVNAGKVATAHDTPVAFAGSTVTEYLLIDPATGRGLIKLGVG